LQKKVGRSVESKESSLESSGKMFDSYLLLSSLESAKQKEFYEKMDEMSFQFME